jgi:signal transduction histidine kinase/ActR/RegA family two-component response regulator
MVSRFLRLRNWNTLSKIVGMNLTILLVSSLAIIFYIIPLYERSLLEEHKSHTSNLVDMATSVLSHYHSLVEGGQLTLAEAQQSAITSIRVMAQRNDYIWIHDLNLIMVVHPYAPQLERTNLADYRDPSGKRIFVEMNRVVKASGGKGFLEYLWPKPGNADPLPKISCIKLFEPWGWVVGSGLYYDDKKRETLSLRRQVVAVSSTLFAVIVLFSLYAGRRINQPLKQALRITSQITQMRPPGSGEPETPDEPRQLLHAIETMVTELKEAKDEAERANNAKSDFLARMSHEIRTPMNAVVGMTELAMESATSLEQKEYLEGVRSSAEHLTELISDILDFSKIEAGHLSLERIPFSLRELLDAAFQPLVFRARQKGLSCTLSVAPGTPDRFIGDPLRLRQIITNLVGNAVKFTSQGGVMLWVEEVSRQGEEVTVAVSIRDTGIGIPREVREHIFDPFVQADGSTTRRFGGTGLGLAIVRQLVEAMGGGISLASEPGRGSEFRFTAPFWLAGDQLSLSTSRVQGMPAVSSPAAVSRRLSVLVAEDIGLNQVIITRFLEKLGHCATVVTNGREAVEAWRGGGFDLVLMDIQMPEMDGLEATRAIREYERARGGHTPIIAMTAHVMQKDVALCLEAGMDDHLDKPLSRSDLEQALERLNPTVSRQQPSSV